MYLHRLIAFLLALVLMSAAWGQVERPSSDTARRATRCSVIFGMIAKESQIEKAREANAIAKRLSLRLALLAASKEQLVAWLDEMEPELASANEQTLLAFTQDCRSFWNEQREALSVLLDQDRIK